MISVHSSLLDAAGRGYGYNLPLAGIKNGQANKTMTALFKDLTPKGRTGTR